MTAAVPNPALFPSAPSFRGARHHGEGAPFALFSGLSRRVQLDTAIAGSEPPDPGAVGVAGVVSGTGRSLQLLTAMTHTG